MAPGPTIAVDLGTLCFTREWPVKNALVGDSQFNRTYAPLTLEQLQKLYANTTGFPTSCTDYNAMLQACRRLGQIFLGLVPNTHLTAVRPANTLNTSRHPQGRINMTEKKAPKEPKAEKTPKAAAEKRNGITRPAAGTVTGSIWAAADKLSAKLKRPPLKKEVTEALPADINASTVATQYGKWRRFYGLARETRADLEKEEAAVAAEAKETTEDEVETEESEEQE